MEQRPNVSVSIRTYLDSDHDGVKWLFERTPPWGRTYPRLQPAPDDIAVMPDHFRCRLVATEMDIAGEAIIGFAAAGPAGGPGETIPDFVPAVERSAQLYWMSVAPERWRLGIGRRLITPAIEWAASEGYEAMILTTTVEQRGAIALYEAAGFANIGEFLLNGRWRQNWMRRAL